MNRLVLLLSFLATVALFPLREYLVTGTPHLLPGGAYLTYATQQGAVLERSPWSALTGIVGPNVAFLLGYPKVHYPEYALRPHWLLLWGAYLVWIWRHRGWTTPPTVVALHLYVLTYLAVMLPNAWMGGYGYRYVVPLMFVLVLFVPGAVTPRRQSR